MELAALIVSIVAVTTSGLGVAWTVYWSRLQHRETTRPKMNVSGSFAVLATEPMQHVFAIRAVNDGLVPVTLTGCMAEAKGSDYHVLFVRFVLPAKLPVLLTTGEHWEGMVQAHEFREGVTTLPGVGSGPWPVRVGVRDAASRGHWSPWFDLRPED